MPGIASSTERALARLWRVAAIGLALALPVAGNAQNAELAAAMKRWHTAALSSYEYGYRKYCACHPDSPPETIVTVRDGKVVGVRHRPVGYNREELGVLLDGRRAVRAAGQRAAPARRSASGVRPHARLPDVDLYRLRPRVHRRRARCQTHGRHPARALSTVEFSTTSGGPPRCPLEPARTRAAARKPLKSVTMPKPGLTGPLARRRVIPRLRATGVCRSTSCHDSWFLYGRCITKIPRVDRHSSA